MHVGICAENIQRGLNKAPWPLACLQILITHPRRQSAPLTLFHESSVLMHSQEQALKPSKQALDLIFNKKKTWFINMENITGAQHKENHMDSF